MRLNKVTHNTVIAAIGELRYLEYVFNKAAQLTTHTVEDYICKNYIDIQSVSEVAKEVNVQGYRLNGRKYIGKDISNILNSSVSYLGYIAKAIHKYNNTLQNGKRSFKGLIKELKVVIGEEDESRSNTK
ncbi:MAG: hypothetical protein RR645_02990 [Clostridium sp.]